MGWPPSRQPEEVTLSPESIETLARRLAELLQPTEPKRPRRMVTAKVVAERWGIDRRWVYEHAEQLGAHPLGDGPRPRLRFDPIEVAERLAAMQPRSRGNGRR